MNSTKLRKQAKRQLSSALPSIVSFCVAVLGGLFLFGQAIIGNLISLIINIGLDQLRAELVASLVMTAAAALLGTLVGRQKVAALLGATAIFGVSYLARFLYLELQPVYDPGKHLEPLNMGNLAHTIIIMAALGVLGAFIGVAVGAALSEVLFNPLLHLFSLWRHRSLRGQTGAIFDQDTAPLLTKTVGATIVSWFVAVMMVVLIVLASSSSNLFLFSPDTGLHSAPIHVGNNTQGTVVQDEVISPALKGQKKPFLVYLPPSYNTPAGRTKRYPVLYLLHGSPGTDIDWLVGGKAQQSADTLIALGKTRELILILPDGNGRPGAPSEWGNSFDQHQLIETYVAVDLVRYVDHTYRTLADAADRGIGGLSMGGFGAMNIAVHHPDVFGTVISLGGYYRAEGTIWGNNAAYMQKNSPLDVLPSHKDAWKVHMFIGGATNDQPYYSDSKQFVQELSTLHIPYTFDIEHGAHAWSIWQTQLYNALLWLHWGVK